MKISVFYVLSSAVALLYRAVRSTRRTALMARTMRCFQHHVHVIAKHVRKAGCGTVGHDACSSGQVFIRVPSRCSKIVALSQMVEHDTCVQGKVYITVGFSLGIDWLSLFSERHGLFFGVGKTSLSVTAAGYLLRESIPLVEKVLVRIYLGKFESPFILNTTQKSNGTRTSV